MTVGRFKYHGKIFEHELNEYSPFQNFFQDKESWKEKCKTMNESGNFLIEVVREPIAAEIKNKVTFKIQN